jgi:hypothetical protein
MAGVPGGVLELLPVLVPFMGERGMAEEGCCFWDVIGKVRINGRSSNGLFKFK